MTTTDAANHDAHGPTPAAAAASVPRPPAEAVATEIGMPRGRFAMASLLIVAFALLALVRAMQEPSTGWRFVTTPSGIEARATAGDAPPLHGVRGLRAGAMRADIDPLVLTESAGILNRYADHDLFFARQAEIWALLRQPQVQIEHAQGMTVAAVRAKELDELGARFWFPWGVALVSLSVGLAVWAFRPGDRSARWYLLASVGYAFGMLCTAGWGSRLLTQPPVGWRELHVASHAASFMLLGGLCMLLWRHPQPVGWRWFPVLLAALCGASLVADAWRLTDTIAMAFRLPVVLLGVALIVLYAMQWRASRSDPVRRAQIKWLGLLLFAALSVVMVAYAFGAAGHVVNVPQNYGLGWVALVFVGLVPLVTRVGLFRLDRWWTAAWLWFLGGLLVVALDLLLLALLPLSDETALAMALALGGWLYFPLRQSLWRRLSRGALPGARDVLPDVVALLALPPAAAPGLRAARWQALWERLFQPQSIRVLGLPASATVAGEVAAAADGQQLWLPAIGALPALALGLPARGERLFNASDLRRASEVVQLVRQGLAASQSYERGMADERERIAGDLHDDLGARLLAIAQSAEAGGSQAVAQLARAALEDMRLSVRGMAGRGVPLGDALADWRAETVQRLDAAGFEVQWDAQAMAEDESRALVLPARVHLQLTRVLREAVSNAIRHSGGRRCRVGWWMRQGWVHLEVDDDGVGLALHGVGEGAQGAAQGKAQGGGVSAGVDARAGMGLSGIERRARRLGGAHAFESSPWGGLRVHVQVPLAPPPDGSAGAAHPLPSNG